MALIVLGLIFIAVFVEPRIPAYARARVGLQQIYHDQSFSNRMTIYYDRIVAQSDPQERLIGFVDDSIVQGWNLATVPRAINLGIGSESSEELLDRIGEDYLERIPEWYLVTGINDVGRGLALEDVPGRIQNLQTRFEGADILFWQALLPTSGRHSAAENAVREEWNIVAEEACAGMRHCIFIPVPGDVAANVADYTSDGVHPNAIGYAALTAAITPIIQDARN